LFIFLVPLTGKVEASSPDVTVPVTTQADAEKLAIYIFWGDGCPHCALAKPFLEGLADQNPSIELYEFEIYYVEENQKFFADLCTLYGIEPRYVPTIFIGERYWEGYNDQIKLEIQAEVDRCLVDGCPDKGIALFTEGRETPTASVESTPEVAATEVPDGSTESGRVIKLPLIGEIDLSNEGLFLSTLLIAFVDGFNPCSIWVLSMLLAITLHTGSRKKVLLIGLVFLTVTALIYALFIAGLFTVFKVVSFVGWIRVVVALVALFFAVVNIKDYFFYKEGVSFTISDKQKPGIYQRMRKVLEAGDSVWGLIGGTIVLAAGVSLVEFSCTAGFPVLWTNLVAAQNVTVVTFILLLLVYMIVYQLDELGIFLVAVFTLKSNKLEEKHGRILKLIGGVLMLTLAVVMLVKPEIMSDIGKSLIVFAIAFGITLLILLVHRVILPRLGVRIGTEGKPKKGWTHKK
jgi:glutaredoxin